MDLSLIVYVTSNVNFLSQTLLEISEQSVDLEVELIAVDGGAMNVSYEKISDFCREHSIIFSVVRQDPLDVRTPGFHVAASRASGRTLVYLNPDIRIPTDYFEIAESIGRFGKVLLPRAWVDMPEVPNGGGIWAAPDAISIIMLREIYLEGALTDVTWATSTWPKADAYLLASRLAVRNPGVAGMATVGGLEHRCWSSLKLAPKYLDRLEYSCIPNGDSLMSSSDIRCCTLHSLPFEDVVATVPSYQSPDAVVKSLSAIASKVLQDNKAGRAPEELAEHVESTLNRLLDGMLESGNIIMKPTFKVEVESTGGDKCIRIVNTGDVLLPFERERQEII